VFVVNQYLDTILMERNTIQQSTTEHNRKSEEQMRAEGRVISRAIDNYQPLKQSSTNNNPQSKLTEAVK